MCNKYKRINPFPIIILGLLLLGFTLPAEAATGTVSPFVAAYSNVVASWYSKILGVSEEIFYTLFGIDFVYLVAQWLIGGKDVHEIFSSFIKKLITIGFFYTVLLHSQQLLQWVLQGFQKTGELAGGSQSVTVSSLFDVLMQVWTALLHGPKASSGHGWLFEITHLTTVALSGLLGVMFAGITALIVLLVVVYVAIEFFAVKMEALLVGSIGALMLGFSGSRWTVQYAEGFFKYALSVGVRLLVLTLWIGFVMTHLGTSVTNILNIASANGSSVIGLLDGYGEVLIFFLLLGWLTKKLPSIAGSVLAGSSSLSGGELVTAGASAAALAGAAVATGGAAGIAMLKNMFTQPGGALTAVEAAALDASTAGSLGSAGGMGATGGTGSLSAAGEIASTTPGEARLLGENGGWRQSFDMGGGDAGGPAPQMDMESLMKIYLESMKNASKDSTADSPERPKTFGERFEENRQKIAAAHAKAESLFVPGVLDRVKIEAGPANLKHSE